VTRRSLQIALGLLWLLDGALQLQPFMLGTGFAWQVILPNAAGQPQVVSAAIRWNANVIAAHPVAWDVPFALTQLLIGVGLLVPRTARLALAASIPWSLGVWFFGEGLGLLPTGHTSLSAGAPGAALLYGVLALAAWPRRDRVDEAPAHWLTFVWAVLWVGGSIFQLLLGRNVVLAVAEALVGLLPLCSRTRALGLAAGFVLAIGIWAVAQNFGQLSSGQATDPNSAALIALLAVATLGVRRDRSTKRLRAVAEVLQALPARPASGPASPRVPSR